MHKCVRRNLFDPNPYQLLAGTSIHVQPLPTRGGGWGSREQSRRCHGGVYCDCVAYFDSRGRCFWKGFFLLNELADGNTNQVVGSFVEKLCKAAPGQLRRGRPVEQLTHLLTYSLTHLLTYSLTPSPSPFLPSSLTYSRLCYAGSCQMQKTTPCSALTRGGCRRGGGRVSPTPSCPSSSRL